MGLSPLHSTKLSFLLTPPYLQARISKTLSPFTDTSSSSLCIAESHSFKRHTRISYFQLLSHRNVGEVNKAGWIFYLYFIFIWKILPGSVHTICPTFPFYFKYSKHKCIQLYLIFTFLTYRLKDPIWNRLPYFKKSKSNTFVWSMFGGYSVIRRFCSVFETLLCYDAFKGYFNIS